MAGASAHRTNMAVKLSASIPVASAICGRTFDLDEEGVVVDIMLMASNCNRFEDLKIMDLYEDPLREAKFVSNLI